MITNYLETLQENSTPDIYDAASIVKHFPLYIESKRPDGRYIFRWDKNILLQLQRSMSLSPSVLVTLYTQILDRVASHTGRFRITGMVHPNYVFITFMPRAPLSAQATPFVPVANLPENNENIPALAMREVMSNIHRNTRRRHRRSQKRRNTRRRR
jgi:hypothetical protein